MLRIFRNSWQSRELLWVLAMKEFNGSYRQSLLGLSWALIQPLAVTFLGVLLRSVFQQSAGFGEDVVFMFAASLPWAVFSNSVLMGTASVVRNGDVLKKVYFPREVFVISAALTRLVDFAVAGAGLAVAMALAGVPFTVWLATIPLLLAILVTLAVGISLLTAAAAVYKRDVMFGMPFVMMFWMFLSPVFYEVGDVPEAFRPWYMLNPMAGVVTAFRQVILYGHAPGARSVAFAALASAAVLAVGYVVFKRLEMRFADVI